jgi:predicted RNA-binding protein with PIN domain
MHYFIDGYNLLFRLLHGSEDLQSQREAIIYDLNQKVSLVKIDVSIVFDSTFQIGERTRTHYDQLEILFTAEGETADEYIMDEIKNHAYPQQETVVTSDKKLAWQVRNRSAHTETVEEFILWLNRAYKNRIRQFKKEKHTVVTPPPASRKETYYSLVPPKDAPLGTYTDYYAQVFESEWQEILIKEEEKCKQASLAQFSTKKRPPRKPKKRKDPFEAPQTPEEKAATETERWLRIFEKRLTNGDDRKK